MIVHHVTYQCINQDEMINIGTCIISNNNIWTYLDTEDDCATSSEISPTIIAEPITTKITTTVAHVPNMLKYDNNFGVCYNTVGINDTIAAKTTCWDIVYFGIYSCKLSPILTNNIRIHENNSKYSTILNMNAPTGDNIRAIGLFLSGIIGVLNGESIKYDAGGG
jgi:hypothetical protein